MKQKMRKNVIFTPGGRQWNSRFSRGGGTHLVMIGVINLEKELVLNRCVSKTAVCLGIIAEEAIHLRKEAVQLCILLTLWKKINPQSSDGRRGKTKQRVGGGVRTCSIKSRTLVNNSESFSS
jgi:hypothetical protein